MKISVVIPVYNSAQTLERCVRSVAEQEGAELEIILVDDGSRDASPQLCEQLSRRHAGIVVVHKDNGGLSDARNQGIARATGDYLTFVDSDDYLAPSTYQGIACVLQSHPEYDIVEYPIRRFCGSPRESLLTFDDHAYTDMADYWLSCRAYEHSYACNKVFRRSLFGSVRFPKGKVFEDVHTLPLLLDRAKVVATTSRGQYMYCANPDGITATANAQAHRDLLDAHINLLPRLSFLTPREHNYYMHILNIQITENQLSGDKPRLPHVKIKPRWVARRYRTKALLLRLLGVAGLCRLNRMMKMAVRKKH